MESILVLWLRNTKFYIIFLFKKESWKTFWLTKYYHVFLSITASLNSSGFYCYIKKSLGNLTRKRSKRSTVPFQKPCWLGTLSWYWYFLGSISLSASLSLSSLKDIEIITKSHFSIQMPFPYTNHQATH